MWVEKCCSEAKLELLMKYNIKIYITKKNIDLREKTQI